MRTDEFAGKVAFITAAGVGIGRAIATEWGRRGGTAVVSDIDGAQARAVAQALREDGGEAFAFTVDAAKLADIQNGIAAAREAAGGIDVLFNVAGRNIPRNVEEMEEEEWYAVIDTNLTSIYRCAKLAVPEIRRRGGGAIVNVASIAGVMAENRCAAYTASKGGVVLLTRNMAMDFAVDGIRVNAICPGSTRTPRTEGYWRKTGKGESQILGLCPMKRSAEPEEIARPAVFLASSDASYITGAALVVDGGLTAGIRIPSFDQL